MILKEFLPPAVPADEAVTGKLLSYTDFNIIGTHLHQCSSVCAFTGMSIGTVLLLADPLPVRVGIPVQAAVLVFIDLTVYRHGLGPVKILFVDIVVQQCLFIIFRFVHPDHQILRQAADELIIRHIEVDCIQRVLTHAVRNAVGIPVVTHFLIALFIDHAEIHGTDDSCTVYCRSNTAQAEQQERYDFQDGAFSDAVIHDRPPFCIPGPRPP